MRTVNNTTSFRTLQREDRLFFKTLMTEVSFIFVVITISITLETVEDNSVVFFSGAGGRNKIKFQGMLLLI